MYRRLFSLAVVATLCLALCAPAMAGPVLDRVMKNKVLRVGVDPTYPPMAVKAKDGQIIGYEVDLAKYLAGALKVKLELVPVPFPKAIDTLLADKVDLLIVGMTVTPQRNAKVMFAGPYMLAGQSVLASREIALNLSGPADLNKPTVKVAAAKGTTGEMAVKDLLPKCKYTAAKDQESALKLLLDKKVDAVLADYPFCMFASFRYQDKGIVTTDKPFTFEPLGMGVNPKDPLMHNMIQNFLFVLQGSGRLEMMQKRWFQRSDWMSRVPK